MIKYFFVVFCLLLKGLIAQEIDLPKGKMIAKVTCVADPNSSYALYLPKDYDKSKSWPIVIGFSPAARGTDPVQLCMAAAEKFGYIIVGSNDSKNGDSQAINQAYTTLKNEILARFNVDKNRVYSIGMSGGSRVALRFAETEKDFFKGVIACAAFVSSYETYKEKDIFIYGIVGDDDFNYPEYPRGTAQLLQANTPYWLEIYKGVHQWPEAARVYEALELFDYWAVRKDIEKATPKAEAIISNRVSRVEKLIAEKQWIFASAITESLLRNFSNQPKMERVKALRKQLDDNPEFVAAKKAEEEILVLVLKTRQTPVNNKDYWQNFNKCLLISKQEGRAGMLAKNALKSLNQSISASYREITESTTIQAIDKAFYFQIAFLADPADPRVPCASAYYFAIAKDAHKTLSMLNEAAKLGFSDAESIEKEKEFEFIKEEFEFKNILENMRKNKEKQKK